MRRRQNIQLIAIAFAAFVVGVCHASNNAVVVSKTAPQCTTGNVVHVMQDATPAVAFNDGAGTYKDNLRSCWQVDAKCTKGRLKCALKTVDVEKSYDFLAVYTIGVDGKFTLVDADAKGNSNYYADPAKTKGIVFNLLTDYSEQKEGFVVDTCVCEPSSDGSVVNTDQVVVGAFLGTAATDNPAVHKTTHIKSSGKLVVRRGGEVKFSVSNNFPVVKLRITLVDAGKQFDLKLDEVGTFGIKFSKTPVAGVYTLHLPHDVPVAYYDVDLYDATGNMVGDDFGMYVQFNPYVAAAEEYMAEKEGGPKLKDEYVLNANGIQYTGQYGKNFNYGNDEIAVIEATYMMLRGLPAEQRRSAAQVVRHFTLKGAGEVLRGRWDGKYEDGASPSTWSSSGEIILKWKNSGAQVKYGQCWVFAALGNTVARSVGLAARAITNIDSAHEQPSNGDFPGKCMKTFMKNAQGKWEEKSATCSVWNFHVWNMVWLKGQWHSYDLTYQESSLHDNQMKCGPAPNADIKAAKAANLLYDVRFIKSETNCDIVQETCEAPGKCTHHSTDTCRVGSAALTKAVGSSGTTNVMNEYKDDECGRTGTRMRFTTRHSTAHGMEHEEVEPVRKVQAGALKCSSKFPQRVVSVGDKIDFSVTCECAAGGATAEVDAWLDVIEYTGRVVLSPSVWRGKEKSANAKFSVAAATYVGALVPSAVLRVAYVATCGGKSTSDYKQLSVDTAPLTVKLANVEVGAYATAEVTLANNEAHAVDLVACQSSVVSAHSGSAHRHAGREIVGVKKGASHTWKRTVKCTDAGKNTLGVSVTCKNGPAFVGSIEFECTPSKQTFENKSTMTDKGVRKFGDQALKPKVTQVRKIVRGAQSEKKKAGRGTVPGRKPLTPRPPMSAQQLAKVLQQSKLAELASMNGGKAPTQQKQDKKKQDKKQSPAAKIKKAANNAKKTTNGKAKTVKAKKQTTDF